MSALHLPERIARLKDRGLVLTEAERADELEARDAELRIRSDRQRELDILQQIPWRYQACTVESWKGSMPQQAIQWDPEKSWCLLVFGAGNGVGKTHLATATWRRLAEHIRPALWRSTGPLLRSIYAGFGSGRASEIERSVTMAKLLLLDDLGRQHRSSEDARSRLVTILCERYDWRRPTIITTNLRKSDLAQWDPALADRIYSSESVIVGRQGESWRSR